MSSVVDSLITVRAHYREYVFISTDHLFPTTINSSHTVHFYASITIVTNYFICYLERNKETRFGSIRLRRQSSSRSSLLCRASGNYQHLQQLHSSCIQHSIQHYIGIINPFFYDSTPPFLGIVMHCTLQTPYALAT